ncbi:MULTISPECIES: alpha,alpha-trehalose-phosphate synthase (UDP-forming) [Dyella]|uniref:Trehalose-6-phosphate synthase n=2 Tax=Dyella TaxID=231454 RepID=A0A4V2NLG1_9GAMM|nr:MULTISPECIES: alpha,alpha-trehalose-phosphate synthase (UDP-forming) [Dyella]TBR37327.1 alpha,alpha-trehalose-phosphate synthase (UDP-forming) [Dyella terrae]TCI08694.1 alpha,alpha-trehalose-phosphate synthase (UDP-forming) [Dyella soli]
MEPAHKGRLIVVSNRVALPQQTATGGLASAMRDALQERGGLWFGWSGKIAAQTAGKVHTLRDGNVEYATIDLSRRDHDDFYDGYANRTLWPLLHYRPDLVDYNRRHLDGYLRVNSLFADRVAELIAPDDLIWVNDYHLIPLAAMLRQRGVRNRIGFFLHTPLPAAGLLITLPRHRELLETLASYDLVGVHTARDLRALEDYFVNDLGATMQRGHRLRTSDGRRFKAGAFAIGIDTQKVAHDAAEAMNLEEIDSLHHSLEGRAMIIGVDRLDYSKGLPERFDAYAMLLERVPELHRKVTFLQIAPPSRSTVPEYRQIRRELERRAGHINGMYAAPDWVPIRYVNNSFPHSLLDGYYRTARVGLVTPLRDGMNLVAKEYVASQDPKDPGVLVLSRFAGAAQELPQALLVNPADPEEVAEALEQALSMPLIERKRRWRAMMDTLEKQDVTAWRQSFLGALME